MKQCGTEIAKEAEFHFKSLTTAAPNMEPIFRGLSQDLTNLRDELQADQDTAKILRFLSIVGHMTRGALFYAMEMGRDLSRYMGSVIYTAESFMESIPELWETFWDQLVSLKSTQDLHHYLDKIFVKFVEAGKHLSIVATDYLEKLLEATPYIVEKLEDFKEFIEDAAETIEEAYELLLDALFDAWKYVEEEILEDERVQRLVKSVLNRAQTLVTEIIQDVKERIGDAREYILKHVNQNEMHELLAAMDDYIEKKLKGVKVDDCAALTDIYVKLSSAFKAFATKVFSAEWPADGLFLAQV